MHRRMRLNPAMSAQIRKEQVTPSLAGSRKEDRGFSLSTAHHHLPPRVLSIRDVGRGHDDPGTRPIMNTAEKLLVRALKGETQKRPPIWLMRQAGRYLPEYRAARAKAGSFLDLCY